MRLLPVVLRPSPNSSTQVSSYNSQWLVSLTTPLPASRSAATTWPWPGWEPSSPVSSMPPLAALLSLPLPLLLPSTPPAPTRPTSSRTSLTSRTRRTRRLHQGQWSCGYLDVVYAYKPWKHKLSIESDSQIQIPTKACFANRGMTIQKTDFLHL
jgi:hypothetical protein